MSTQDFAAFFQPNFNWDEVPEQDFTALPPGKYPVSIESAELKETKAGGGHYIKIVFLVLDGPCKGRKLYDNINVHNANDKAVAIAMDHLNKLRLALHLPSNWHTGPAGLDILTNGIVIATVKVDKTDQNQITAFAAVGDGQQQGQLPSIPAPAPSLPQPTTTNTQPSQTQGVKPPWQR